MKKFNKKRIIIGLIAVVVLTVVVYGVGRSLATPSSQTKTVKVNGLSFENASVVYKNNLSTFTVDVYNENKNTYKMQSIDVILTNKDSETITLTYEIDSLEADEGRKIIIQDVDYDLTDYTKISYKINK